MRSVVFSVVWRPAYLDSRPLATVEVAEFARKSYTVPGIPDTGSMRFGILGTTEVRSDDGTLLATGGTRRKAVLTVLALEADRLVTTERLIEDVYGHEPPAGVANALQSQISRLRRTLSREGKDVLKFRSVGYQLAVDPLDVDAHRFEHLATCGREAIALGEFDKAAELLGQALELWRGPALADVAEETFAQGPAHRLSELRLTALENLMTVRLAQGEGPELVEELQSMVASYPLRERLRGHLMRALDAAGRRTDALTVFAHGREYLAEELGVDPSPELDRLHTALLRSESLPSPGVPRGEGTSGAAPRDPERRTVPEHSAATGVPAQLTTFVGRVDEPRNVSVLLEQERLVTLSGPGGVGKTRLAIEVAHLKQNVCFVDLSFVETGASIAQAVLNALGVREPGWTNSSGQLTDEPLHRLLWSLHERPLLIVLDNCEHVLSDVAHLVKQLLDGCSQLRILATSQEVLGITGEVLWPVVPLPLPPANAGAAEALRYPSVQLLNQRAAAVRPDFEVDDSNVESVTLICRALDGIPLAIELAAARLNALPPEEIARRLDDRFLLLTRGSRTAAPKHQTLRSVVEWSWGLLDEREKRLARRFSVFTGGADLDAAREVCDLGDETPDVLAGLVEKSFIEVTDNARRYRMLSTIRAFAAEQVAEFGEADTAQRNHAGHYLDLMCSREPYLRSGAQAELLAQLVVEHDNLHAALRWAVEHDSEIALSMLASLSTYWWLRSQHNESAPLAYALLQRIGDDEVPESYAEEYVLCTANAAVVLGDAVGEDAWRRAEAMVAHLAFPLRWPLVAMLWPTSAGRAGRGSQLISPFLERCQDDDDPWVRAVTYVTLGYLQFFQGDPGHAELAFNTGLAAFRDLGDQWGVAQALVGLATVTSWRGDLRQTLALTDEGLTVTEWLGVAEDSADLERLRAEVLLHHDDLDGSAAAFKHAIELAQRSGARGVLLSARCGLGQVERLRGNFTEAGRLCETVLQSGNGTMAGVDPVSMQRAVVERGRLHVGLGSADQALLWFKRALAGDMSSWNPIQITLAAEVLAEIAFLKENFERAAALLGTSVLVRGRREVSGPDPARLAERARHLLGERTYLDAFNKGLSLPRSAVSTEIEDARLVYLS